MFYEFPVTINVSLMIWLHRGGYAFVIVDDLSNLHCIAEQIIAEDEGLA